MMLFFCIDVMKIKQKIIESDSYEMKDTPMKLFKKKSPIKMGELNP
jgi:hypothetical protein